MPTKEPLSPSSGSSDAEAVAVAGNLPGSAQQEYQRSGQNPYQLDGVSTGARTVADYDPGPETADYSYYDQTPTPAQLPQQLPQRSAAAPALAQMQPNAYQDQYAGPPQQQQQPSYPPSAPSQTQDYGYPPQSSYQQPPQPEYQQPSQQQPANAPPQQYQQQPFLDGSQAAPPPQPGSLPRPNSMYGDWMAPAAGAAAGAGAGLMGAEYWRNQRNKAAVREQTPESHVPAVAPGVPLGSATRERDASIEDPTAFGADGVKSPTQIQPSAITGGVEATSGSTELGGLEAKGARETGRFPVLRHDTNVSISALHVPGEYPSKI